MLVVNTIISFILMITNTLLLITYKKLFAVKKISKDKEKKVNNVM